MASNLFDLNQQLYAWTSARGNRVKRWDAAARTWVLERSHVGGLRSGDGAMKLGKGLLVFRGNEVRFGDRIILKPPGKGRYYNFYYAQGRLFFYHTERDQPGFTLLYACSWDPAAKRPIDLAQAAVQQAKYVGATPFARESMRWSWRSDRLGPGRQVVGVLKPQHRVGISFVAGKKIKITIAVEIK